MKTRSQGHIWFAAIVVAAMTLAECSSKTGSDKTTNAAIENEKSGGLLSREKTVTLPAGTTIPVVLDQSLSSNRSRSGDTFEATVSEPVVVDGKTVVPKDAHAKGRALEARPSGHLKTPARLSFALISVEVGGTWHDIETSGVTLAGKSHKKRDIEIIGGGSALGAIIGGIAGHGKGAAIGAGAGAGAGTLAAAMTGKKDISLPAESHVSFRLTQPLAVVLR